MQANRKNTILNLAFILFINNHKQTWLSVDHVFKLLNELNCMLMLQCFY